MFTEGEINWIRDVLIKNDSESKLTEDELNWIKQVLVGQYGKDYDAIIKLPPHYVRQKIETVKLKENKGIVRKDLDTLREKMKKFTPKELIELGNKHIRDSKGIENFSGIYIIHNSTKDIYYVGKSVAVFNRAYNHFVTNPAENVARYRDTVEFNLPEIYTDYLIGDKFSISLIPFGSTSLLFSSIDELERNGISAYNASVEFGGYNRTHGNVINKRLFRNEEHQKVAEFMLDKIKETESFKSLKNNEGRKRYTFNLLSEYGLPNSWGFISPFAKMIQEYQKANKANK
ncbi:GIY-YIG nuclease family protein [Peribacillus sp. AS_2]|uniref:GIY-YIG nuclease family protein n=1 Tax=Peribacillus sp. AS_2 TaxID=2996755 RepID=UPI0022A6BB0B|nr:GIY-YIG nuclease family protein [Peribacillus sp. AS_2]MCZ0872756.1 GIY-YIG nuclease family protein [Peribacillus sp. AS_2]